MATEPDETTINVPRPTEPEAELAWSLDSEDELDRQPWPVALRRAGLIGIGAVLIAGVIALVALTIKTPAPARLVVTPPTTVTVQAAPPTTPVAPLSPDDQFIAWLNADNQFPEDKAAALHNGHQICTLFDQGKPKTAIVNATKWATGLPDFAAYDFVKIAVNAFCPEHVGLLVG